MRILDTMRRQKAVYWDPAGTDETGRKGYAAPVELRVRWEDVQEMFTDKNGSQSVSKAKVYPGEDLDLQGVLWHGALASLTSTTDPFLNPGASEIRGWSKLPTARPKSEDDALRIAYL